MSVNNISAELSDQDVEEVKAAFKVIESKLPFLVNLPDDELASLFKLGSKSADFVSDAQDAADNFGQILPSTFDKKEFLLDATLFKKLAIIKLLCDSLSEKINDTYRKVGSEAMNAALELYAHVQINSEKVPGLKSVADKLKERFKKARSNKEAAQSVLA